MRRLLKKLEAMFSAAAFAEEGDAETARRIMVEADTDAARDQRVPGTGAPSRRPRRPVNEALPAMKRVRRA